MKNILKKPSHYMLATILIESIHVLWMTYLFPREWLVTQQATLFVNSVASVVPALRGLMQFSPRYTQYWGVFYATFWCITPIFVILGALGTFFFTVNGYQNIRKNNIWIYPLGIVVFFIIFLLSIFIPFIGNFPNPFFNQMSSFLPLLMLAWSTTAMCPFALGWAIGCLIQKLKMS